MSSRAKTSRDLDLRSQAMLSQPERKLLRLPPKGDLGRQEKTRKQQRVDVDAHRLPPGLGEDVMEQIQPRSVGILATETVLVGQTKAWEWRMRCESMFNRHDAVGSMHAATTASRTSWSAM